MDLSYLQKEIFGTKLYEWAIFLANAGIFIAYINYYKKHPDMFDKLNKKLGLEKKVNKD
jgi:hypothetical protein